MAINVTVAGVGGTTVTLPWTSVTNAAAAQSALAGITNLVTGGVLTQVNYTGGSTLPAVGTAEGGVVAASSVPGPLAAFALGGQYVSAVLGGSGVQEVLVNFGANNTTIVSGAGGSTVGGVSTVGGPGGAQIGNLGSNTQVFLGGAATQDFSELGLGPFGGNVNPSATVWVTTPLKGSATFDDSSGQTTINLDTVASTLSVAHPFGQTLVLLNSGNGQTTINVASAPTGAVVDGDALSFRGTSTVATTVNAAGSSVTGAGGVSMWALLKSGNVFINGDGSNVILFPTGTGVSATLFGGAGSDIDAGAGGLIQGGSAGNNVLFGSLDSGSTTLIGGGQGDVLVNQGANNLAVAGATSNEQLYALAPGNTLSGAITQPVPVGANLFMNGITGGDTYITGNAAPGTVGGGTTISMFDDSNGGNLVREGVVNTGSGASANSATIQGFHSGVDALSLANPASPQTNYVNLGNTTTAPQAGQLAFTFSGNDTKVTFGDGTTWTVTNAHLVSGDFH